MPADPFVVHVARLQRVRGTRWHEVRPGEFDPEGCLRPTSEADSSVPVGADALADVVLDSFDGGVMVTGTVRAPWAGVCRRCTAPVDGELVVGVRERFTETAPAASPSTHPSAGRRAVGAVGASAHPAAARPGGGPGRRSTQSDLAARRDREPGPEWATRGARAARPTRSVEPEDDEAYPIVDEMLDLGPMIRDAIVLELPLAPLCSDDCRGLCPHCGVDRNSENCDCAPPRDPRWASLDVLRPTP